MRWKLLRRRLSVAAPRVIVRRHLPWPLRWALAALVLGFSGAIGLWAFELGRDIAGLERGAKQQLAQLRDEVQRLRDERDRAQAVANTAESLLRTERAAQESLRQQLRRVEADKLALEADLGFFERLLPAGTSALAIQAFQVEPQTQGRLRFQLLVMQGGKVEAPFNGRYEFTLTGLFQARPWTLTPTGARQSLVVKQHARVEGVIDYPPGAVVKTVQIRVVDPEGSVQARYQIDL